MAGFCVAYTLLFGLFIHFMGKRLRRGPGLDELPPPAHHLGQLFPGADDIAFLRQQHAISTPQHKRQRVAQLDGFDVQADEVHGGRYII